MDTVRKYQTRLHDLEIIEADIRRLIGRGEWGPGMLIPSRRELGRHYSVDHNVVQRALIPLVQDGTLVTGSGRGTYVASPGTGGVPLAGAKAAHRAGIENPGAARFTVGIIATIWNYDGFTREPQDNHPEVAVRAAERVLARSHVSVRFWNTDAKGVENQRQARRRAMNEACAMELDGLILVNPTEGELSDATLFHESGRPIVALQDMEFRSGKWSEVIYDGAEAGALAAGHLLAQGYTNISFYCPYGPAPYIERRYAQVEAAVRSAKRTLRPPLYRPNPKLPLPIEVNQIEVAYQAAGAFLAARRESWGIVAVNDHAAHGLLRRARELGLRAGLDFGLVGFDDRSLSRELDVTSLHPPFEGMGSEAAKILVRHLEGDREIILTRLRSYLVMRGSTRPPRHDTKPAPLAAVAA